MAEVESVSNVKFAGSVFVIVMMFPEALVAIPVPPTISRMFARGTAVPESVTNSVATCGVPETFK